MFGWTQMGEFCFARRDPKIALTTPERSVNGIVGVIRGRGRAEYITPYASLANVCVRVIDNSIRKGKALQLTHGVS